MSIDLIYLYDQFKMSAFDMYGGRVILKLVSNLINMVFTETMSNSLEFTEIEPHLFCIVLPKSLFIIFITEFHVDTWATYFVFSISPYN